VAGAQPLLTQVQRVPECGPVYFDFTDNGSSAQFDNRFLGCKTWYVSYTSTGFPAVTLTVESASDNGGVPGVWGVAGSVVEGVNPNVAVTEASTVLYGYAPWYRVTLSGAAAGADNRLRGVLYGYRQTPLATVVLPPGAMTVTADQGAPNTDANRWPVYLSDGSNPVGTAANPFVVQGPAAGGSAVSGNPVLVGGSDGTDVHNLLTDGSGILRLGGWNTVFDGLSGTSARYTGGDLIIAVTGLKFNGTGYDRPTVCANHALINTAAAGNTEIITLSAGARIRVCHISLAAAAPVTVSLQEGTGAACAIDTHDVTGPYQSVQSLALDFDQNPLVGSFSQALCLNLSAAVQVGGVVTYAQY
jgi:hypothetical protein